MRPRHIAVKKTFGNNKLPTIDNSRDMQVSREKGTKTTIKQY